MNDFENELERLLSDVDKLQVLLDSITPVKDMNENSRILGRCDFHVLMIKNHLVDLLANIEKKES